MGNPMLRNGRQIVNIHLQAQNAPENTQKNCEECNPQGSQGANLKTISTKEYTQNK